jgi:hypothetical protein
MTDLMTDFRQASDKRDNILLAAYAKLPEGTTAQRLYDRLVLVVIFERASGIIRQAEISFATETAQKFLAGLLIGYNLNDGADGLVALIQEVYFGPLKKAVIAAVKAVVAQYEDYQAAH